MGGPPQRNPSSNCYLSDWPTQEINPTTMPDMDGAEIYERGSFGRGCEPYPFPPFKIGGQSKFPRGEDGSNRIVLFWTKEKKRKKDKL